MAKRANFLCQFYHKIDYRMTKNLKNENFPKMTNILTSLHMTPGTPRRLPEASRTPQNAPNASKTSKLHEHQNFQKCAKMENMKNLKNSHFKRAYGSGTYLDLQGASRAIDPCRSCRFSWLERRVMVEKRSFRGS